MFLWARLQIQNLCDPERMILASDVEDALHYLPATLYELYRDILERIDRIAPHGRILATKTLKWLLCAREPLRLLLLPEMLQSSEGDSRPFMQDILDLYCNLVVFDDSLDVFRFCHASVREFLELQPRFSFQNVNIHATQECVKLVLRSFNAPITSQLEFTMYAREFWIEHYIVLNSQSRRTQSIANEVKDFYVRETRAGRISEMFGGKIVFGEDPVVGIPDSIVDR